MVIMLRSHFKEEKNLRKQDKSFNDRLVKLHDMYTKNKISYLESSERVQKDILNKELDNIKLEFIQLLRDSSPIHVRISVLHALLKFVITPTVIILLFMIVPLYFTWYPVLSDKHINLILPYFYENYYVFIMSAILVFFWVCNKFLFEGK
jgi:hypothetical protein